MPNSTWSTSLSLLERARSNDSVAWTRLCQTYSPLVYGWARRGGIQEADAVDVVQEVFRAVCTGLHRFQKEQPGDTFRGWLLTITRNELRQLARRNGRQVASPAGGSTAMGRLQQAPAAKLEESSIAEDCEQPEDDRRILLRSAIESVKSGFEPQTFQAFWRCVVDGVPAVDVAKELGMKSNAVRQAKFRVLTRLRECVEEM